MSTCVPTAPSGARVVVPGTFDPVTRGHLDVIRRARGLFACVTVAVAVSANKNGRGTAFTLEERCDMISEAMRYEGLPGDIEVVPFEGLLVDFCHERGAVGIVKGLRAMTDFEYELQQANLNGRLDPEIESVFVMSSPEFGYVSSSVVREIAAMGSDVGFLVTPNVEARLREHYA